MKLCKTNNENTGSSPDVQQSKPPPPSTATTTRIQQDKNNTFVNYTTITIRKTFTRAAVCEPPRLTACCWDSKYTPPHLKPILTPYSSRWCCATPTTRTQDHHQMYNRVSNHHRQTQRQPECNKINTTHLSITPQQQYARHSPCCRVWTTTLDGMLLRSYKYTTTFEINTYPLLVQMTLRNNNHENTRPPPDVQRS
jgi:hypothetical protein